MTFRRGFLERVHLHLKHFLHHRRQMLALEPIREVCLTGLGGGRGDLPDLVRRVAGCAEWAHIETLQIHHQGPHRDPASEVLTLLESPHLSGLRALRCPSLSVDADARRRFERLPLLQRLTEFWLPGLEDWPHHPGEWFSDGPIPVWSALRSLALGGRVSPGAVRQLLAMPFWSQLSTLSASLHYGHGADSVRLDQHLPPGLRELDLRECYLSDEAVTALVERLRGMPLRRLGLVFERLPPVALARLLDGTGRLELEELHRDIPITEDQAEVLTHAPGLSKLHSLTCPPDPSYRLFAPPGLSGLTHFADSEEDSSDRDAVHALTAARHWDRLRSLTLSVYGVATDDIVALLAAPHLRRITVLTLKDGGSDRTGPGLDLTVGLAQALLHLPHLAYLDLRVRSYKAQARQILTECSTLAWLKIESNDYWDIQTDRASRAPEQIPPVELE